MKAKLRRSGHKVTVILGIGLMALLPACSRKPAPAMAAAPDLPCPQWVKFPVDGHSAAESPYLGCVSAANLRAMVADRADLERGKPLAPADGERETRAVEAYKQGKVKAFQGSSASGAGSPQTSSPASGGSSE